MGAATAYALSAAGARVEVLEAGQLVDGTSAATFGLDVSRLKTPRALFELSIASGLEHQALEQPLAGKRWRHPAAWLEWETRSATVRRPSARAGAADVGSPGRVGLACARAQALEPALTLPVGGETEEIALYGEGAWCEPRAFGRALLEHAATRGATVHAGDPVTAVTRRQGRITEVVTARRVAGSVPTAS